MPEVLSFPTAEETHEAVAAYLFEGVTAFFDYVPDVHIAMTSGPDASQVCLSLLKLLTQQSVIGVVHLWWLDEVFVPFEHPSRRDRYTAELVENFRLGTFIECHRAPNPSEESYEAVQARWEETLSGPDFAFVVVDAFPDGQLLASSTNEQPIVRAEAITQIASHAANAVIVSTGTAPRDVVSALLAGTSNRPLGQIAALEHTSVWVDDAAAGHPLTEN